MEFMASLVYVATAVAYVSIGVVVLGWIKHSRKNNA